MSSVVLYCTFRSMVHFELIFVKGVEFFFPCGCPIISAPFVEKTILSLAIELPLLHYQRSADCLCVSISGFSILFHWSICLIAQIGISVELPDNLSQQTKAKLLDPQLIRWLDSHKDVGQFLQFCFIIGCHLGPDDTKSIWNVYSGKCGSEWYERQWAQNLSYRKQLE